MRITCPFCGERDGSEFTYLGDASFRRPDPEGANALGEFAQAVYMRSNPAGEIEELWYHGSGCRRWLKVTRDTRTHAISGAAMAKADVS